MSDPDETPSARPRPAGPTCRRPTRSIRQFVEHWGMMARSWGINATMGELFALLYITGTDWTAEDLREWLRVSRGNVSMNLRELIAWGVVHKVHRQGERREFYRAEADVWTLFRRILARAEAPGARPDPASSSNGPSRLIRDDPAQPGLEDRIATLRQFFALIDTLATRLLTLEPEDLDDSASSSTVPDDADRLIDAPIENRRRPLVRSRLRGLERASTSARSERPPRCHRRTDLKAVCAIWAEGVDNSPWGWGLVEAVTPTGDVGYRLQTVRPRPRRSLVGDPAAGRIAAPAFARDRLARVTSDPGDRLGLLRGDRIPSRRRSAAPASGVRHEHCVGGSSIIPAWRA